MHQNLYQRMSGLLLLFLVLFLSNASVFIHYFWLVPEVVYIETALWLIIAMVSLWLIKKSGLLYVFIILLRKNWTLVPFTAFVGASIIWSVYWEVSFSRWLVFLCILVSGGYLGLRYTLYEFVKYLSIFGIYILCLSLIFIVLFPDLGVMNYHSIQGAWKGIYWHKNHMGFIAALINTLFLILLLHSCMLKKTTALPWALLYIFSLLFVYQTDTVGAYLTVVFLHGMIFLAFLLLKYRNVLRWTHFLIIGVFVIAGSLFLSNNLDIFFRLIGRSSTLTGRIPMWGYLFETYLSQRPYLGYGFNAFWYIGEFRVALGLAAGYPNQIVIADNGFIDLLMNTGYVGLALFLLFYFGAWVRSILFAAISRDVIGYFPVIFMMYTLIANVSWSLIFENEGFILLVMITVLFSISRDAFVNHDRQASR